MAARGSRCCFEPVNDDERLPPPRSRADPGAPSVAAACGRRRYGCGAGEIGGCYPDQRHRLCRRCMPSALARCTSRWPQCLPWQRAPQTWRPCVCRCLPPFQQRPGWHWLGCLLAPHGCGHWHTPLWPCWRCLGCATTPRCKHPLTIPTAHWPRCARWPWAWRCCWRCGLHPLCPGGLGRCPSAWRICMSRFLPPSPCWPAPWPAHAAATPT